eukprot:4789402-Karenia_brevis.AAC.1
MAPRVEESASEGRRNQQDGHGKIQNPECSADILCTAPGGIDSLFPRRSAPEDEGRQRGFAKHKGFERRAP